MATYSHSRLSTFENCPRAYRYRYIDKVKMEPEFEGIEAFMGSRVHETLEKLYRDIRLSRKNSIEDILAHYCEIWEKNWHNNIKIVKKGYTQENYFDTGARCIADYYNKYQPFNDGKTLGLEQIIYVDIDGYRLKGFIDRLSLKNDNHYEIHDYKTSQYLPALEYFRKDRQLALYQIGLDDMWEDAEETELVWHYLVHNKEIRVKKEPEDLEKLKEDIVGIIQKIEMAEDMNDFPAVESNLCSWCEFQPLCPNHAHIIKTEQMPKNRFLEEPGVRLVNRYTAFLEEKRDFLRKIDTELKELKEALVDYSKREGVEVIAGSNVRARVKIKEISKYPAKKEIERKELERLLKEAGLWERVSDLNVYTLAKMVDSESLEPELLDRIKVYHTREEDCRIYLSKRRDVEE